MSDALSNYPDLAQYLDDSDDYTTTTSEFSADGKRWLLVTQSGEIDGGQMLFQIIGSRLLPAKADTVVDLNPKNEWLEELRANPAPGPASAEDHAKVADKMRSLVNTFSTREGPDGGNLACVWAVRHIVKKALGRWITRVDHTAVFAKEMQHSFPHSYDDKDVLEGGIILSPTVSPTSGPRRIGHVGLLGPYVPGADRLIYSNSSAHARWEQNFTQKSWIERYKVRKNLKVLYYPIPAASAALVARQRENPYFAGPTDLEPTAALRTEDELELLAPPNPLAGEGPPEERGVVLFPGLERATGEPPINKRQAKKVAQWLKHHFGPKLQAASEGTPFSVDLLCAMVCKESAYFWLGLVDTLPVDKIVARCVLDASGDYPGTSRSAFPVNTAAFRHEYGDHFTQMLIDEANATRALRNFGPKPWVYKGYGIFQFDLQAVKRDRAFFEQKQWYDFDTCLNRAMSELKEKYRITGDLWRAVKAYNGSGPRATEYANHVFLMRDWCAEALTS